MTQRHRFPCQTMIFISLKPKLVSEFQRTQNHVCHHKWSVFFPYFLPTKARNCEWVYRFGRWNLFSVGPLTLIKEGQKSCGRRQSGGTMSFPGNRVIVLHSPAEQRLEMWLDCKTLIVSESFTITERNCFWIINRIKVHYGEAKLTLLI